MSDPVIHIDFETRSPVDLKRAGMYRYFEDPDTDAWCACYAIGDAPVRSWRMGEDAPLDLCQAIHDGMLVYAHNAGFERACFTKIMGPRYGWPVPDLRQMRCTAAMAAAMGLPRDLDGAAVAAGLSIRKDEAGKRVMMQMARPRNKEKPYTWWNVEAKIQRLIEYCIVDVEVERMLEKKLLPLDDTEQELWFLDQRINERGVRIDLPAVKNALWVVNGAVEQLNAELSRRTKHNVQTATNANAIRSWLHEQGLSLESLDKQTIIDVLPAVEDPNLRRVLEIRQQAGKASTAKLKAMQERASSDGRARDNLMFHGAHTGRWSGRGIQMQNFPRPEEMWDHDNIELAFELMKGKDYRLIEQVFGPALPVVSNLLRSFLIADDGKVLARADFSNIEGRVLAWLAGEEWKLDAFRAFDAGKGPDLYKVSASAIYGIPVAEVTKSQRQIGKVAELALGYQGGVGAFQSMAGNYGIVMEDAQADEIKVAWRERHPATKQFWYDLEDAAMQAVLNKGHGYKVGRVAFGCRGGILWCKLPSGRKMAYVDPKIREVETPWGDKREAVTYMAMASLTRKWTRHNAYGGHWAENVTQATARDVMRDAMFRLEDHGYENNLTVHDEIISEVEEAKADKDEFERLMRVRPNWAEDLPLAASAEVDRRYGK